MALQVLHYDTVEKKTTVLVPRVVNNDSTKWEAVVAEAVAVNAGDKIHFYYDRNIGEGCDDGNLNDGDECTSLCGVNTCGNGVLEGPEGDGSICDGNP